MDINYKYRKTVRIEKKLIEIEVAKKVIDLLPQFPPHILELLRQRAFLKSALFSARIEGNKLRFEEVKDMVGLEETQEREEEDSLLPRRQEILAIIKDHKMVSFDFLKRRFYKIPDSSLHYDIRMLIKKGFIKKLGDTRGVLYELK